ncbi:MAG: hypothetical protein GC201_00350 [Alphaproteobacteria bacterium]|nr:hypothetical protein [Alphaproteobacteria bacterium]
MADDPDVPPIRPDGLQLDEHRAYQERLWTVERWAWAGFVAITIAAALGATGSGGPLARSRDGLEGGTVEHPRVTRWQTADEMSVELAPGGGERTLFLGPAFPRAFAIEEVQPQPAAVEVGPDGEALHFRTSGGGPARIVLSLRARHPGLARYAARIDDGAARTLSTLILP